MGDFKFFEAEKLCMELQELEDAEQNLDEVPGCRDNEGGAAWLDFWRSQVLKKQAEAAQKSADVVLLGRTYGLYKQS